MATFPEQCRAGTGGRDAHRSPLHRRLKRRLGWTSQSVPGFRSATLLRSEDDPLRFTSVSEWDDDATLKAWKTSPGFQEKFESVKGLCDEFLGGDYDVAATFSASAPRS